MAQRLGAWVPLDEVPDVWEGVVSVFRDYGYRRLRTKARLNEVHLLPMSEVTLTPEVRRHFRQRYVELFGPVTSEDPLYESISAGRQHQGMEHWLPLFHDRLETLFDYLPDRKSVV